MMVSSTDIYLSAEFDTSNRNGYNKSIVLILFISGGSSFNIDIIGGSYWC